MLDILFLPFILCIILTVIHTYFGFFVVKRGIIFVDLALAQIAALGALIGLILGIELHTLGSYIFSFGLTIVAAIFLSFLRVFNDQIQQEGVIGILYVFAAAVSILILSKAPKEAEHIKYMLVGNILFIKVEKFIYMLILYFTIAILHFLFRKNFFALIENKKEKNIIIWDFLFYVTFGAVVTSSVEVAGVLLVFSFLIVPVMIAFLFVDSFKKIVLLGWFIGVMCSLVGIILSVLFDLPTGATIVSVFGVFFIIFFFIKYAKIKINMLR